MRTYKVVDAFSRRPFKGNPVAVVLDGSGLSDAEMQAIARWTNLSETTFVLPPKSAGASYRQTVTRQL
jgi:PhzF family phenazine biosynthesis protein